jgi:hypothetical protein
MRQNAIGLGDCQSIGRINYGAGLGYGTHFHRSQPTRAKVQSYWEKGWKCTQSAVSIAIGSMLG